MSETQVGLVEPQTFTVNLPAISAPVAVCTESDEVVILVRLTLRPRDNVMNLNLDVSAGGDRATVSRLDQNPPHNTSGDFGPGWYKPPVVTV